MSELFGLIQVHDNTQKGVKKLLDNHLNPRADE